MPITAAAPARRIGRAATAPKTANRLSIGDLRASHYAAQPANPAKKKRQDATSRRFASSFADSDTPKLDEARH
jgi:hypothetical protein